MSVREIARLAEKAAGHLSAMFSAVCGSRLPLMLHGVKPPSSFEMIHDTFS